MAKNETGWPLDVCVALENLAALRESAQGARKSKFDELKTVKAEVLDAIAADDEGFVVEKKAQAYDIEEEIGVLQYKIAWYADQSQRIIKAAAEARKEPELFDSIDVSTSPPPKPKPEQMTLKDAAEGDKGSKKDVDVDLPEGVNQHMAAPISELDLPEPLTAKLIEAGYRTIAAVDKADSEGYGDLELSTKEFNAIKAKLRAFVKKHNKAQIERDRE